MSKVVFADANVLIAAAASRTGASHALLLLAESGLIQLVVSRQVLDEVERNLRRKLPDGLPLLLIWLAEIGPVVLADPAVDQYQRWFSVTEPKDAPIIEAAVQAGVDYLLTLNTKDFTPEVALASGLMIQTPSEFIQTIRQILSDSL
ncbi:MAG: PIN domain-containing protein [Caldilineaceae bacterium]|nr:PIN domain-containing protein [Caldilineaceae bacterium]